MGEYALYNGESVKIGTCEDLYYLRADQARLVRQVEGQDTTDWSVYRFRFPFPDEDSEQPGGFDDYSRRMPLRGVKPPEAMVDDHYKVQFTADGYNVCLPCPEASENPAHGLTVHRNGFNGAVFLSQQRLSEGVLMPVLECRCGVKWRVPLADLDPIIDALEAEGHAMTGYGPEWCRKIAERIGQGFDPDYVASLF
jgi:hypothetical protein